MALTDYTKALTGGILAGLAALSVALINNGDVNGGELGLIIGAFVAGTGLVGAVPNTGTFAWVDEQDRLAAIAKIRRTAKEENSKL